MKKSIITWCLILVGLLQSGCSSDISDVYGGWHYMNQQNEYAELWISENKSGLMIDETSYQVAIYSVDILGDTISFFNRNGGEREFWIYVKSVNPSEMDIEVIGVQEFELQRIEDNEGIIIDTSSSFIDGFYDSFKKRKNSK